MRIDTARMIRELLEAKALLERWVAAETPEGALVEADSALLDTLLADTEAWLESQR